MLLVLAVTEMTNYYLETETLIIRVKIGYKTNHKLQLCPKRLYNLYSTQHPLH